jgi:alkylation response protein AidB-like acyl-CoA dehydrogenase
MPWMQIDDASGALALLRDSVAGFAQSRPGPAAFRARRAAGGDLTLSAWRAFAQAGWTGLSLPEPLGGLGLGAAEQAVLSEALGRELIAEPLAMSAVFPASLLAQCPPSAERDRLCDGLASGAAILAVAWRAPLPHVRAPRLSASPHGDGYRLHGEAHFVDAALSATDLLALAATPDGAVLLSLAKDAGVVETRPGVDGAAIGLLRFSGAAAPAARVLAKAPAPEALLARPLADARLALAAELAGLGARALEMTIEYAKNRVQFGKPIASFQVIQHRLVEMLSDAEFACAAVVNAVEAAQGGAKPAELAVLAAKARAGDSALSICRRAIHLYGAMGITDECDIGLYLKRALALNATLGQPEELRQQFVALERAA